MGQLQGDVMTDDDTDRAALQAAERSAVELSQTEAAFGRLRAAMVEELLASPVAADALREKLYLGVQVLDGVRRALHEAVGAGDVVRYRDLLRAEGLAG
jgi:hypothetical protein